MNIAEQFVTLRSAFSDWVSMLPSATPKERKDRLLVLHKQIEKIYSVASDNNMTGFAFSASAWFELLTAKQSEIDSNDTDDIIFFSKWLDRAEEYVNNPVDETSAYLVIDALPSEYHHDLKVLFDLDREQMKDSSDLMIELLSTGSLQDASVPNDVDFGGLEKILLESGSSLSSDSTVLDLLCEQVMSASSVMENCVHAISVAMYENGATQNYADTIQNNLSEYIQELEKLAKIAEAGTLQGISLLCRTLISNIDALLEAGISDNTHLASAVVLLANFPNVLLSCLRQPENDSFSLALAELFENQCWQTPLSYIQSKHLLYDLINDLDFSSGNLEKHRKQDVSAEDISLTIPTDVSKGMMDAFFIEVPVLVEKLTTAVSKIRGSANVLQRCIEAQRLCHTLKGSANLINVSGIANFAHYLEDILQYLGDHNVLPSDYLATVIEDTVDQIAIMLEAMQGQSQVPHDLVDKLRKLLDCANRVDRGELLGSSSDQAEVPVSELSEETSQRSAIANFVDEHLSDSSESDNVILPRKLVQKMLNMVAEMTIAMARTEGSVGALREYGYGLRHYEDSLKKRQYELEDVVNLRGLVTQTAAHKGVNSSSDDFDSLEMNEYNELFSVTHSYIEAVADSVESSKEIASELTALEELYVQQKRLNRQLQDIVMSASMVTIDSISSRLQRVVRQTARTTQKQVLLTILGEDILVDADIVDRILDPLMHILRNAVDHGIEIAAERSTRNKAEIGNIELSFRKQGNFIYIKCADDGCGLDYAKIYQRSIARGLLKAGDDADRSILAKQIFQPGFTTRTEATQVSGRGVGLDVVQSTILNLNGSLHIYDNSPCGVIVECRIPTRLLTTHCVLVDVGNERYAIPTTALKRVVGESADSVKNTDGKYVFSQGEEKRSIKTLASLLGIEYENLSVVDLAKMSYLLHDSGEQIVAIAVDSVISAHELVVKDTGSYVGKIPGITGVTFLNDGRLVPVLNVAELVHFQLDKSTEYSKIIKRTITPTVLVVDDSLSARKSMGDLVSDMGYKAVLARDGIEALKVLENEKFNLVLTDLEMPRMSGLELASYIRRSETIHDLPIILVTSRTMQKHRQEASKVGVTEYVTKPYAEDQLYEIINKHI